MSFSLRDLCQTQSNTGKVVFSVVSVRRSVIPATGRGGGSTCPNLFNLDLTVKGLECLLFGLAFVFSLVSSCCERTFGAGRKNVKHLLTFLSLSLNVVLKFLETRMWWTSPFILLFAKPYLGSSCEVVWSLWPEETLRLCEQSENEELLRWIDNFPLNSMISCGSTWKASGFDGNPFTGRRLIPRDILT